VRVVILIFGKKKIVRSGNIAEFDSHPKREEEKKKEISGRSSKLGCFVSGSIAGFPAAWLQIHVILSKNAAPGMK
jgi:hypothetical protein